MRVWRIARRNFPVLDGEGARRVGGRWNSPGVPVVYAAGSRALAALEVLVWTDPEHVPDDLALFEIDVPDSVPAEALDTRLLDADWRSEGHPGCRSLGDG